MYCESIKQKFRTMSSLPSQLLILKFQNRIVQEGYRENMTFFLRHFKNLRNPILKKLYKTQRIFNSYLRYLFNSIFHLLIIRNSISFSLFKISDSSQRSMQKMNNTFYWFICSFSFLQIFLSWLWKAYLTGYLYHCLSLGC